MSTETLPPIDSYTLGHVTCEIDTDGKIVYQEGYRCDKCLSILTVAGLEAGAIDNEPVEGRLEDCPICFWRERNGQSHDDPLKDALNSISRGVTNE